MKDFVSSHVCVIRFVLVAALLTAVLGLGVSHHAQNQGARTERSPMSYDKDGNLVSTETDFDDQNRPVEKREIKGGKVRKRIHFTYLKGFTKPNTSTTEYGPDGKTPVSIKNDDVDKDGNPTSSVTTTYDEKGNETGGSKRERDPNTGKDRCYRWDPKKQAYEEVTCPGIVADFIYSDEYRARFGPNGQNARVETGGGLRTVTFGTPQGQIHVYLPDDMMAGDTISGTVVVEPEPRKQSTENDDVFRRQLYIDFLHREKPPGSEAWISRVSVPEKHAPAQEPIKFVIDVNYNALPIILKDADGKELGSFTLPIVVPQPAPPQNSSPPNTESSSFQLPSLGQAGRTSLIAGPFDGNSSNTLLKWCINLTPACEQNPSTGGVIAPLAESPRQVVFRAPINVTGPVQIQLNEGKTETKGQFRNIKVDLSAPKTNLLKGESTTLKIEVQGLQGITQPVPLHLVKGGVVTTQGGDVQTISIKPGEVQSNGTFTTTRNITGVQTGGWNATVTVVVFNVCLQDDNNGNSIILNRETGDYIFCAGSGGVTGANPISLSTIDFAAGITVRTGQAGDAANTGPIYTLDQFAPDRTVQIKLTGGLVPSGTATVQTTNPKQTFTITDRDMRNNTCTCR